MKSTNRDSESILGTLAMRESHFRSGTRLSVLEALIYKCIPVDLKPTDNNSDPALQCLTRSLWSAAKVAVPIIKRIHEVKLKHMASIELAKQVCIGVSHMNNTEITDFFGDGEMLYRATSRGIREFLKICLRFFPELTRLSPGHKRLTAHAVRFRQERILGLFLQVSSTNQLSLVLGPTEKESAHMMYAAISYEARKYSPSFDAVTDVAGAAFQIQRELQWYKAVQSWVLPNVRNGFSDGQSCWNAFVEKHKDLLESGEKWVKNTSNSCMLVSTLIATVLFTNIFIVPEENGDRNDVPLLLGQDSVQILAISNALGLFSFVTAILLFLAILTSRYEAQDFLYSLPKKIIMGLSLLFLSLAFMLVAFAATLTMALDKLDKRLDWALIPVTLLASVPVALFVVLQLPLLFQMVKSTYGPSIFRPESIWE
ncbi:hypothetical protein EUGRSUZ_C03271 [Eucalyptus grandis]|uniref:Uncharacterized protein n=2 Tax=Eucalyptus grandis TaxID=71139 RepID=A0ACC3LIM5_EUCGR|nr:hypothetical protein EUGRSUZ_C03271 [Eucalyptus grandis]